MTSIVEFLSATLLPLHEIGHSCSLEDIYTVFIETSKVVTGDAVEERLPRDWGNGFYPGGLSQENVISRLLMYGFDETDGGVDLPLGHVYGLWHRNVGTINTVGWQLDLAPVGLDKPMIRQPVHE